MCCAWHAVCRNRLGSQRDKYCGMDVADTEMIWGGSMVESALWEDVKFRCCAGGCGRVCHHDISLSALCGGALRAGSGALAKRSARQLPACPASAHHGPFSALVRTQTLSSSCTAMLLIFRLHQEDDIPQAQQR